jgi:hypothetical protein
VRRVVGLVLIGAALCSCGQKQVVYRPPTDAELVKKLVSQGIDPCRVYPCTYAGKTAVEIIDVPPLDRGDFIVYPHKEAVIVKPIDAVPPLEKVKEGRCQR